MSKESTVGYLPHIRQAVGAAYLLQQSSGGEMVGGLEVVLRVPKEKPGKIRVSRTT